MRMETTQSDMNNIAKKSASERLKKAMELEKIGPSETARKLNILSQYISMSQDEKYWPKMSRKAWDRILLWCNSGETIHHFKIPIGEVKIEEKKRIELPPKILSVKPGIQKEIKSDEKALIAEQNKGIQKPIKEPYSYLADMPAGNKPEIKPSIEVIPPATECIEEMDAVKIKIIIDLQIYVNGREIKL